MSYIDDFFEKKRKESQSSTQPTDAANFRMEPEKQNRPKAFEITAQMPQPTEIPTDSGSVPAPSTTWEGSSLPWAWTEKPIPEPYRGYENDQKREERKKKSVENFISEGPSYMGKIPQEERELVVEWLLQEKNKQSFIRAATESDIPVWSMDPKDPNNFMEYEKRLDEIDWTYRNAKDDPMENIALSLNIGRDQVFNSIGKMQEWAYGWGKDLQKASKANMEMESAKINKPIKDVDISDSRFWTQTFAQQIPFMLALAPAAVWGATAGASVSAAAWLWTVWTFLVSSFGAGLASRAVEGLVEGAETYSSLVSKWVDHFKADEQAWGTTRDNMALMFSDVTQMAVTFAPIKNLRTATKMFAVGGKFVVDAASEGWEEVWQGYVQQYHQNVGVWMPPMSISEYIGTKEAQDSFMIWASAGLAFGSVGVVKDVWENLTAKTEAQTQLIEDAAKAKDPYFPAKVDYLVKEGVIKPETGASMKQMFDTKLKEIHGINTNVLISINQQDTASKVEGLIEKAKNQTIPEDTDGKPTVPYAETTRQPNLTTKILEELGNRETVSKQFIVDLTKRQDIKQAERSIILKLLENEGDKIDVKKFKESVLDELLPLKVDNRTESKLRLMDLEDQKDDIEVKMRAIMKDESIILAERENKYDTMHREYKKIDGEINKIKKETGTQYESVTLPKNKRWDVVDYSENVYEWPLETRASEKHFKWQTKKYALHTRTEDMGDGETRRVIEVQSDLYQKFWLENEKEKIRYLLDMWDTEYVVVDRFWNTEVRQKWETQRRVDARNKELWIFDQYNNPTIHFRWVREEIAKAKKDWKTKLQFPTGETAMEIEQFPIEKRDESNPIYKFYEKELSKYLKTNYDAKLVTDEQWVTWYEVDLSKVKNDRVTAFQDPAKDYHEAVARKFGGENLSKKRTPMDGLELLKVYKALEALTVKYRVILKDRVYDKGEEVIAQISEKNETVTFGTIENRANTWFHEVTHGFFKQIMRDDPERGIAILQDIIKEYGITQETADREDMNIYALAEEYLADETGYFYRNEEFKSKTLAWRIKQFIKELVESIKGIFWKEDYRYKLFQDIVKWRRPTDGYNTRVGKAWENAETKNQTIPDSEFTIPSDDMKKPSNLTDEERQKLIDERDRAKEERTISVEKSLEERIKERDEADAKEKARIDAEAEALFGTPSEPAEKPKSYLFVSNPKSDAELIEQLQEMKWGETTKQFRKNNAAAIANTADNFARIFQGNPTVHEVQVFLKGKSPQIMQAAYQYGVKRNMFDVRKVDELVAKVEMGISAKTVNAKGSGLSSHQKATVISMEWYGSLLKGTENYKINMTQLSESIKKLLVRMHFLETPGAERKKIPFTLMGNKAATIQRVIQPLIEQAVKLGKTSYVEPFSGAGTSLYILPKLFAAGLKEADLNFFDREKYIVVKAIQDGEINVGESVDRAWNTVIDAIADDLMGIPAIKEIMDDYGAKPGTPEFYAMAEMAFYPQYAKQFFEETPDAKLAKNGEITETFKEWLAQKVMKDQGIDEESARTIAAEILSDTSLFEKNYPWISKSISDRLESFDDIDNVKTVDDALVTTFARHMKQRGTSGQRIVSASNGFQDMFGAYKKTLEGLKNYEKILRKHGDKIHIHSMDGKEFIAKMGKEKDLGKTVAYFDPPYVRTTAVYVKNAPEAVKMSLWEYADYGKIPGIFDPLKEATAIYTNDIDGKYFEALGSMYSDRLNKDILGYREGTTPTSVVTTSDLKAKPGELRLDYYQLVRSNRLRTKMEALSEDLLPMVQDQLKKELAKVIKEVFSENADIVERLTKIREGQEKSVMKFEDLKNAIEKATTGRDRQALLQEAMRAARDGNVTGKGLVAMLRYINKYWEDRQEAIRDFRDKYDKFVNSKSVDIVQRQEYEKQFGEIFTVKKLTGTNKKEIAAVEKGLTGQPMDSSETELFQKYLFDHDHYLKVNGMRGKKSIYDMDIEQIKRTVEEMETAKSLAHDQLAYREKLKGDHVEKLAAEAREKGKALESYEEKANIGNYSLKERLKSKGKKYMAKLSDIINEFITSKHIIDEKLRAKFLKRDLDTAASEYRRKWVEMHVEEMEIAERNELNDKNFQRIVQHAYAREGDGNGAILLAFQLEKDGEDFVTLEKVPVSGIAEKIAEYADEGFLTEGEREWYEFSRRRYDITGTDVQRTNIETYNMMMGSVENYTPHFVDYSQSPIEGYTEEAMDQVLGITVQGMLKTTIEKGFTVTRTGMKKYPMMDAKKIFYRHMNDAMWYAEIQGPLKIIQEVVNKTPEVWGNAGNAFWKEWIDVLAKNGKMQIVSKAGRGVEWLGERAADTVLILNPGTIAKQLLSLPDAYATSGKLPVLDMAATLNPTEWKRIMGKSEVLPYRQMELMRTNYNENFEDIVSNITRKIREYGYAPMSYIDLWVGASVFRAVYDGSIKEWMTESEAVKTADDMVKYAIYSPFVEDMPMFITKHKRGVTSVFTRFMGPSLTHFSNIMTMGWEGAQKKFGKWGSIVVTAAVLVFLSALYSWAISKGMRKLKWQKAIGGEGLSFAQQVIGQFWPLSIAMSAGKFGDISFMGFADLLTDTYGSIAEEWDKREEALFWLAIAIMTIFGVPGINSVAPYFKPKKKKAPAPVIRGRFWRKTGTTKKIR